MSWGYGFLSKPSYQKQALGKEMNKFNNEADEELSVTSLSWIWIFKKITKSPEKYL